MNQPIRLSVIIPAYNEEKRLPKTLAEINKYLAKQNYDYEILVASDGSKDNTVQVVEDLKSQIANLRLIDNKENRGKGYMVRQAMLEAKGDFRLFIDADNSTSIDQIEKIWPEIKKGYDVVIGSRDIKGAVLNPPQPWFRNVILGEGFKLFRKIVIGLWGIEDTQCGFKCLTREAVEKILPKCQIDRFAFDPEILVIAEKMRYKIKEIPVYWRNDLESKVKFKSMLKMAFDLLKIKWNLFVGKYE
jgi:dolichyl-phosphate beta-glucosyltransferase